MLIYQIYKNDIITMRYISLFILIEHISHIFFTICCFFIFNNTDNSFVWFQTSIILVFLLVSYSYLLAQRVTKRVYFVRSMYGALGIFIVGIQTIIASTSVPLPNDRAYLIFEAIMSIIVILNEVIIYQMINDISS